MYFTVFLNKNDDSFFNEALDSSHFMSGGGGGD